MKRLLTLLLIIFSFSVVGKTKYIIVEIGSRLSKEKALKLADEAGDTANIGTIYNFY